jgi:hypothetical protein
MNVNKSAFFSRDLSSGEKCGVVIGWYKAFVIAV